MPIAIKLTPQKYEIFKKKITLGKCTSGLYNPNYFNIILLLLDRLIKWSGLFASKTKYYNGAIKQYTYMEQQQ